MLLQVANKVNLPSTAPKYWNGKPANGKPRQIDMRMRKRNGKRGRGGGVVAGQEPDVTVGVAVAEIAVGQSNAELSRFSLD